MLHVWVNWYKKLPSLESEAGDEPPTCPLRPVILDNACPPRITAAAGTELAGTFPSSPVTI